MGVEGKRAEEVGITQISGRNRATNEPSTAESALIACQA